jgi:hypothetical protein
MQNNDIPLMTDPLGRHWPQPSRDAFLVDETHAIVSAANFKLLPEYSGSMPSGVYPGKMWRRHDGVFDRKCKEPIWMLCWYGESPDPGKCSVNHRLLLVA